MITSKQILDMIAAWDIDYTPKYRRSVCTGCGKQGHKFWHIWLEDGGFMKEVHLCRKCGEKYKMFV